MDKKIWLSINLRSLACFGSEKIRPGVRPPLHVSRGEILHFKYPPVSKVNLIATRTFRDKNNLTTKPILSFAWLNFHVYFDVDNRERGRARDKKKRRPISFEEYHENFMAAVRK